MASDIESKPNKLSLVALDQETALPVARMPFYAEVGVRSTLGALPIPLDDRFEDAMRGALNSADRECGDSNQCWNRVSEVLRESVSRLISAEARNQLAAGNEQAIEVFGRVISRAREAGAGATLLGLDIVILKSLLDNALRAEAQARGLALAALPEFPPIAWAHPMGILATDHMGYLSFDLSRLPDAVHRELQKSIAARRLDPEAKPDTTIWVYPMAREEYRFDALAQGRFAHDAILLKLQLHELNFHQVIGVPAAEVGLPIDAAAAGRVRPGFVNEYRLSFVPIGHSLGQILYSFPLAPGESVNFVVIDWRRRDSALRNETTKLGRMSWPTQIQ
jgi:hypothetical protein